ncbi:MAG: type II secretion system protein GspE [Chitinivibrionales bacterium]|nr:type II secretion system protein GspE [Chitinivibrionales bacterium]MBD3358250.1 type II secretion system protein GspE [Chitinivibrionales bacterium]
MTAKLGSLLVDKYAVHSDIIENAIAISRERGIRLGECLVSEFGLSEQTVYETIAEQFHLPFFSGIEAEVDNQLLRELPIELFTEARCFPLWEKEGVVGIVVADPLDLDIVLDVEAASGTLVEVAMTTPSEMEKVWRRLFEGDEVDLEGESIAAEYESGIRRKEKDHTLTADDILKRVESEPVVKMVQHIIDDAVRRNASDIHIEPGENDAVIRFRIDGMLVPYTKMNRWLQIPVTSRIKILADLDIAEKRVPQDGRIAYTRRGQKFDLRVSTLPTQYGEKTVLRLLRHDVRLLDLEASGMREDDIVAMRRLVERPQGLLLVTGPTGSGKSTLLFSCLNLIREKAINITTIEDPVEYKLQGVNQVQVNTKAGLNFAATLRSILRQDPDVILVGETRDGETAQIVVQAAQTGHLVLSTLHTNDSVSAITRLKDLGVPPFMVGSSLLAAIGQRLVRRLCPGCRSRTPMSDTVRTELQSVMGDINPPAVFYRPVGCGECENSGYCGRTGLFELLIVDEEVRKIIMTDAGEQELRDKLREHGMRTIADDALEKIEAGITTPDEFMRVVASDAGGK